MTKELKKIGAKVKELTHDNNHTQSLQEIAIFLEHKKIAMLLGAVTMIANIEGYMPADLIKYRYKLMQELQKIGIEKYGENYNKYVHANL